MPDRVLGDQSVAVFAAAFWIVLVVGFGWFWRITQSGHFTKTEQKAWADRQGQML